MYSVMSYYKTDILLPPPRSRNITIITYTRSSFLLLTSINLSFSSPQITITLPLIFINSQNFFLDLSPMCSHRKRSLFSVANSFSTQCVSSYSFSLQPLIFLLVYFYQRPCHLTCSIPIICILLIAYSWYSAT